MPNDYAYAVQRHAAAHTEEYLFSQLIPYIGNKRKLLPLIADAISQTGVQGGLFVDLFAGSGVVARLAKLHGFQVFANDWEPYAHLINHCFVQCSQIPLFAALGGAARVFETLNSLPPLEGYIATHLCPADDAQPDPTRERMFFTRANGCRIDAAREQIDCWQRAGLLSDDELAVLLGVMMYAVSYVSNTSGVFKGFHRGWGGKTRTALYRILSEFRLRPPLLFDNGNDCRSFRIDAHLLAARLRDAGTMADIVYLDPPYNQHPYGSNYHVLNTVALWDQPAISPQISGRDKSAIRTDWRTERRSAYNYATAAKAYHDLLQTIAARYILTSYSTDGNIPLAALLEAAAARGRVSCVKDTYKRYRVSTPRMSQKPLNVEFVLIINTQEVARSQDIEAIARDIIETEHLALHRRGCEGD